MCGLRWMRRKWWPEVAAVYFRFRIEIFFVVVYLRLRWIDGLLVVKEEEEEEEEEEVTGSAEVSTGSELRRCGMAEGGADAGAFPP